MSFKEKLTLIFIYFLDIFHIEKFIRIATKVSKTFENQIVENQLKCMILNKMMAVI